MQRISVFRRDNTLIGEIAERELISAVLHEEINGEHSLTLQTTQKLQKGYRLVFKTTGRTGDAVWHEYAVSGEDGEHTVGDVVIYKYYCVWSLQEDLQGVLVSVMPGVQSPVSANAALTALLSGNPRWTVGTVTNSNTGGASMYDRSAWDALSTLVENWGGEISVSISVHPTAGVQLRAVNYHDAMGSSSAVYRFDFGANVSRTARTTPDAPLYCRISPRGKGEATENGGYGRKVTIESVNGGRDYLDYEPSRAAAMMKNTDGTYFYPTLKVENSSCETPAELLTWAQGVLADYCTLTATYTVDAHRAVRTDGSADNGYTGLSLGDVVQVVDEGFEGGLRYESRVIAMDRDLLDERNNVVQISTAKQSISSKFSNLGTGGTNYSNPSAPNTIGGVEPVSVTDVSAPSNTLTNICSVSLPAGVWIVTGQITFGQNGTGRRVIKLSTTSQDSNNVPSQTMQLAVSEAGTRMSTTRCFTLAAQTTVYLIGNQGSGTTLSCSGNLECTRIG